MTASPGWSRIRAVSRSPDDLAVVLGAGPVGRAVADRLVARGTPVRLVTRSGQAPVPSGVEVVAADVSRAADAERACAGARVVYACVGLDYAGWPERWPPLMRGMLAGAERAGARFVFMDNLYMYGPVAGPMTEDLPLTGYGRKPAVRAALTRMWQDAHEAGRVEAVAVRAADFYGPGVDNSMFGRGSFGRIAAGRSAQCLGNIDLPHSVSYVPDVARALVTLADADATAMGQAWHVPNAPDRTVRQHLQAFADCVGRPLKVSVAPGWLLSVLGLFNANLREVREMLYQWERPFEVSHAKFAARFWSDATPFADGIRETADAARGI